MNVSRSARSRSGSAAGVLPRGADAARFARALAVGAAATCATLLFAAVAHPAKRHEASAASAAKVQGVLASHTFRGFDGRPTTVPSLRGQVVVLNVWASWCGPCRKELPALESLHSEIKNKGGRVMAVSIDLEARNAERFVERLGLTLPVYHDGVDGIARALDLDGVPWTVVLDRSGNVAYAGHGSDAAAIQQIQSVARRLVAAPMADAGNRE